MSADVLLSGAVGALLVFVFGALREWWREEREREGLLRLLLSEIDHNAELERTISERTNDLIGSEDFPKVSTKTWRDVQGRAAALLTGDLFAALNAYYTPLLIVLTLLTVENHDEERMNRGLARGLARVLSKQLGWKAEEIRDPWSDYRDAMLEAREQARAEIARYLALPWDDRLILRLRRWVESRRRTPS